MRHQRRHSAHATPRHAGAGRRARTWIEEQDVAEVLRGADEPLNASAIAREMKLPGEEGRIIARILQQLKDAGVAIEVRPGRFVVSGADGEHAVRIELADDVPVARFGDGRRLPLHPLHTLGARPGDEALAMVADGTVALVTRIVGRDGRRTVGVLTRRDDGWSFLPDKRREGDLPVRGGPPALLANYRAGDRVVGRVVQDPAGVVVFTPEEVLDDSTPEVRDFARVVLMNDLPGEFPAPVAAAAAALPTDLTLAGRMDLRRKPVFTIDPETAKDFDDAISLERLDEGRWRVGIHIADVSHFVTQGGVIDLEAANRGTSVYLMNRVIPMLPEALSNGVCSLVPDADRLTVSVFVDLDDAARLCQIKVAETIIHSRHRLCYEEVQAVLEGRDPGSPLPEDLTQDLLLASRFAQQLRERRERDGALNLFSVERGFRLDVAGRPIGTTVDYHNAAHQLIEEFMLLANRAVAEWLGKQGLPCVYRVHGEPDEERIAFLATMLEQYGLGGMAVGDRRALQAVLRRLAREPEAARQVLNFHMLRSFQKAHYDIENQGHYALAFGEYCHFTSPIRRYPDLLVHRLVKVALGVKAHAGDESRLPMLDAMARRSSYLERRADDAERALHAIKAARYLHSRLGDRFAAVVMTAFPKGLFVQLLEVGLEGRIPLEELRDDVYRFDEERFCLVGRGGRTWRVGDELEVVVVAVDIDRAEVTLALPADGARPAAVPPAGDGADGPPAKTGKGGRRKDAAIASGRHRGAGRRNPGTASGRRKRQRR
jgi:ribonuclease R